ncbi:MAG: type II toxin-antitoxin system VapC family toxin [Deltaproteobacteria bacterium]|nr:type II toxin-antitoxin system VapC family toxin [Deltaproteobacteria bacterium]
MRALDTNVLVRFLIDDDAAQHAAAVEAVREACEVRREPLWIADVVLAEVGWVLLKRYKVGRTEFASVMRRIASSRDLAFESRERVAAAVDRFEKGHADFADYLIAEGARESGCDAVLTFDRELQREPGFQAP